MSITDNEVAAVNEQRRNEELAKSSIGDALGSAATLTGAVVALSESLGANKSYGLAVAGSVVAGMHIVDWFRKLGTGKVEENLAALGQATEDAFSRVESVLAEQGKSIGEIQKRFDSDELKHAMASASLRALRTSSEVRLKRMALILANGAKDGNLLVEDVDDMLEAAVVLKDEDIVLLGSLYKWQNQILTERGMNPNKWFSDIQSAHKNLVESGALNPADHLKYRSSYSRLGSLGLIQAIPAIHNLYGVGYELYALLTAGKDFYDRLREIGTE
jgi:hypothetical protein